MGVSLLDSYKEFVLFHPSLKMHWKPITYNLKMQFVNKTLRESEIQTDRTTE